MHLVHHARRLLAFAEAGSLVNSRQLDDLMAQLESLYLRATPRLSKRIRVELDRYDNLSL